MQAMFDTLICAFDRSFEGMHLNKVMDTIRTTMSDFEIVQETCLIEDLTFCILKTERPFCEISESVQKYEADKCGLWVLKCELDCFNITEVGNAFLENLDGTDRFDRDKSNRQVETAACVVSELNDRLERVEQLLHEIQRHAPNMVCETEIETTDTLGRVEEDILKDDERIAREKDKKTLDELRKSMFCTECDKRHLMVSSVRITDKGFVLPCHSFPSFVTNLPNDRFPVDWKGYLKEMCKLLWTRETSQNISTTHDTEYTIACLDASEIELVDKLSDKHGRSRVLNTVASDARNNVTVFLSILERNVVRIYLTFKCTLEKDKRNPSVTTFYVQNKFCVENNFVGMSMDTIFDFCIHEGIHIFCSYILKHL